MATAAETRASIELKMKDILQQLHSRQQVRRGMSGRFWQSRESHSAIPLNGVPVLPDQLGLAGDQGDTWNDLGITIGLSEASFRVDTYDGPGGEGYTLTATVRFNGDTWQRIANIGPEKQRMQGWRKLASLPSFLT